MNSNRRNFIKKSTLGVGFITAGLASSAVIVEKVNTQNKELEDTDSSQSGQGADNNIIPHCQLFQAGEIQMIIGDASRNGHGGKQYCGIWSLTSRDRLFNAFGNSFAGLLPGEQRGATPFLKSLSDTSCELVLQRDGQSAPSSRAIYEIKAPYYVDHTLIFTDTRDHRRTNYKWREVSWCNYMNCPEESSLHFLSNGKWITYISPKHGVGSSIAPSYLSDDKLEIWPDKSEKRPFHWDRAHVRFDEPFYYGRLGNMVLIFIFDKPQWLRFFCSPTGGNASLIPGKDCPAWDFLWAIPDSDYEPNKEYSLRVRIVYKSYVSDDDVLVEVRKTQKELGFETVKH
ncbi:MAG: hypothetical protein M0Q53_15740 [Prolixibacteraceae bacterium]|jgi:hypothetical protein|nr:hypothetical protein [Prolixibacteraceae bacterium]